MAGLLRVVATPIGNLDDLSVRAARAFAEADIIACEDTRVTRKLLTRAPSRARLVPLHAGNESRRAGDLARAAAAGSRVVLVSDAGTPGISDPGSRLVAACLRAGVKVEAIPGPSAVMAALAVAGLPAARFVFEGFLPRTRSARRRRLEALAREERTIVLFEAPHRLPESLAELAEVFGPARRAVLAREMTKVHEEILRERLGTLRDAVREISVRGEVTLVIEGAPVEAAAPPPDREALADLVEALVGEGITKKEAIARVAVSARVPKRDVYQATIDARERDGEDGGEDGGERGEG